MGIDYRAKYEGYFYSASIETVSVKDWVRGENSHIPDCLEFHYCLSGEEEVRVNGRIYSVVPETVRIFPPSTQNKEDVWIRTLKPSEFVDIGFITKNSFFTETAVIDVAGNRKIRDLFLKMMKLQNGNKIKTDAYFFQGSSVFFLLMQELQWLMDSESSANEELNKILEPALDFMHNHYSEKDFVLNDLPAMCGMKKDQFYKKFGKRHHMAPSEYVTKLRMQLAIDLLREGNLSISDIATKVGYESLPYFSRVFKKQFGTPPSKYLK